MGYIEKTLSYYDEQAASFVQGTVNVEFSAFQNAFASKVKKGGRILDLGCGSGRDAKAFIDQGFEVIAIDGSSELCKIATKNIGQNVICATFQEYVPDQMLDGIWACASLLHLEEADIKSVMQKLTKKLNEGGCFYVSFKYGTFTGERNGRFFTDMTEESLQKLLKEIPELKVQEQFISEDVRPGRSAEKWLNAFLVKK